MVVAFGCMAPAVAMLVGAVRFVVYLVVRTPTSPYQVHFSTAGAECVPSDSDGFDDMEDKDLILDEETGEVLYCRLLAPIFGETTRRTPPGVLRWAGRPGHGAIDVARLRRSPRRAERDDVARLAAEIGLENRHEETSPSTLEGVTWRVALYDVTGGWAR
ncbi:hypothetical protein [Streptomyces mayteni]